MSEHGWDNDDWPALFKKVQAADIRVLGSAIWLGEKTSVCTKVIERHAVESSMTCAAEVGSEYPHEELSMAGPTKEYRVAIRVKLTDEILPSPVVSKEELQRILLEALRVGEGDSPVVSLAVYDRR